MWSVVISLALFAEALSDIHYAAAGIITRGTHLLGFPVALDVLASGPEVSRLDRHIIVLTFDGLET
jgi:hypothetical protein